MNQICFLLFLEIWLVSLSPFYTSDVILQLKKSNQKQSSTSGLNRNSSVFTHPPPAGPPTLLEDGERYRGNQLKQSLDGWEAVCLTGKDMNHLKQQDIKSVTHRVTQVTTGSSRKQNVSCG